MAEAVAGSIASDMNMPVSYEVRPFQDCDKSQPDFSVTCEVTDNLDQHFRSVMQAQENALTVMALHASTKQSVGLWFKIVRGKWGEAQGLKERP